MSLIISFRKGFHMPALLVSARKPRNGGIRLLRDTEVTLMSRIVPATAFAIARAEGLTGDPPDNLRVPCGKCGKPLDLGQPCRFFAQKRTGIRAAAHGECVTAEEAIQVSHEAAVPVLLRQAGCR
jgi:hypothetical protein